MTSALILNAVLCAIVLAIVLAVVAWAVIHSHHEGRPHVVARRRQWMRHTISLHPDRRPARHGRPFALQTD